MRAAAEADPVGVAGDEIDRRDRHAEQGRDDLGKARLVTLAVGLGADDDLDPARRGYRDFGPLARRPDRGFDIVRQTQSEQPASRLRLLPARRKAAPVGVAHREVHIGFVGAAVVARADRVAIGHHLRPDQVFSAQFDAVEPQLSRRLVDQPLDRIGHLRTARTAVGVGRHSIGEHRSRAQARRRDVVGAGDERRTLAERRQRHAAPADIADVVGAHCQQPAVGAQRQSHLGHQIAALKIAEKRLRAGRGVFDRPAEAARRPQHQAELDIGSIAHAEIAADIVGQHPHPLGGDAEHRG